MPVHMSEDPLEAVALGTTALDHFDVTPRRVGKRVFIVWKFDPWRWRWAALGLLVLLVASVIFLTNGQRARLTWPEVILRETIAPLQSGVAIVSTGVNKAVTSVTQLTRLASENAKLREEVETLRSDLAIAMEAQRENESLREMMALGDLRQQYVASYSPQPQQLV